MLQLDLLFVIFDLLILITCSNLFRLANFAHIQDQKKVLIRRILQGAVIS